MTSSNKRQVKAWAVLRNGHLQGAAPYRDSIKVIIPLIAAHHPEDELDIVPCTITYTLPRKRDGSK